MVLGISSIYSGFILLAWDTLISFAPACDPFWYPFDDFHTMYLVFKAGTNPYIFECTSL